MIVCLDGCGGGCIYPLKKFKHMLNIIGVIQSATKRPSSALGHWLAEFFSSKQQDLTGGLGKTLKSTLAKAIRNKVFENGTIDGYTVVAIDGTKFFGSYVKHCSICSSTVLKGKTHYYHGVQSHMDQESHSDSEGDSQTFAQRLVYVEIRRSVDFNDE